MSQWWIFGICTLKMSRHFLQCNEWDHGHKPSQRWLVPLKLPAHLLSVITSTPLVPSRPCCHLDSKQENSSRESHKQLPKVVTTPSTKRSYIYHPERHTAHYIQLALSEHYYIFSGFFLFLLMSPFLAADACLSWSLPSITEQQVCSHRVPQYMYAVLAEKSSTGSVQTPISNGWQRLSLSSCTQLVFLFQNNNCFAAKWFVYMYTSEENGIINEATVLQWPVRTASWD